MSRSFGRRVAAVWSTHESIRTRKNWRKWFHRSAPPPAAPILRKGRPMKPTTIRTMCPRPAKAALFPSVLIALDGCTSIRVTPPGHTRAW